ncbi:hypothetical protein KIM372_10370 [Bombiscardovia nodaiensis]|uniref:Uncharacterized protein n=1 Tax=Bombiscardovia nodaiensis TaxID=2932181 RepID=A0ABN6SAH2_9BIFI|nr:hypothetical protein KIM372_10370 [Bombiscardovia nodaiensis]
MGYRGKKKLRGEAKQVPGPKLSNPAKHVPQSAESSQLSPRYRVPIAAVKDRSQLNSMHIIFRFDAVDLEGDCPWSLANMTVADHAELLAKLKEYERSTVGELTSATMHNFTIYHDFSRCPNSQAVQRLGSHYEREGDSIARFSLSGKKRLYGFLIDNHFHIVWWDPEHEIWPSHKKHT